jgi:hypothetical protein
MKTFLQTYPVETTQNVFVALASPCRSKPQGESPGFLMNLLEQQESAFLEKNIMRAENERTALAKQDHSNPPQQLAIDAAHQQFQQNIHRGFLSSEQPNAYTQTNMSLLRPNTHNLPS